MRIKISICFFQLLIVLVSFGCKKSTIINNNDNHDKNFDEIYNRFWAGMNTNYVYWDIDKTNWDSLYAIYKPLFHQLDINNNDDVKHSVSYFRKLTANLIDGHYSITFDSPLIKDSLIYPSYNRKKSINKIHNKYDFSNLVVNYLDSGSISASYFYSDNGITNQLFTRFGTINHQFLYFTCNQFALLRTLQDNEQSTKRILDSLDFYLKSTFISTKGLIIDLRGNGGGDVVDLNFLFGKLIDHPLKIGLLRYKNGNGRFDYTPWVDVTIYPQPGFKKFSSPIIVLVDTYSASLSEAFAMATHILPNGIVVGERTWGATGPIADNSVYNYGGFKIDDFLRVTTAQGEFKYIDNKIYEDIGFLPDVISTFDLASYRSGQDLQLETAISKLISFAK